MVAGDADWDLGRVIPLRRLRAEGIEELILSRRRIPRGLARCHHAVDKKVGARHTTISSSRSFQ